MFWWSCIDKKRMPCGILFLSVDIFLYRFGRGEEYLGVFYVFFERLEGGCILESVAGALVCDDLEVYHLFGDDVAVLVELVYSALHSVRNKYGEISEIIEVVVYRLDSERAHAGDYHRSPEGKIFGERLGAETDVVERFYHADRGLEKEAGELADA